MAAHHEEVFGFLVKSGKSWPIVGLEGENVLLKGEYRSFETDLFKAVCSGYVLRDCADAHVTTLWRKAEQRRADALAVQAGEQEAMPLAESAEHLEATRGVAHV